MRPVGVRMDDMHKSRSVNDQKKPRRRGSGLVEKSERSGDLKTPQSEMPPTAADHQPASQPANPPS